MKQKGPFKVLWFMVLMFLTTFISVRHETAQAITVSENIPVGTNPSRAVITPDGAEVYVSNTDSNTVSVINTATNTVTHTIAVGSQPDALAVAPDGSKVYV